MTNSVREWLERVPLHPLMFLTPALVSVGQRLNYPTGPVFGAILTYGAVCLVLVAAASAVLRSLPAAGVLVTSGVFFLIGGTSLPGLLLVLFGIVVVINIAWFRDTDLMRVANAVLNVVGLVFMAPSLVTLFMGSDSSPIATAPPIALPPQESPPDIVHIVLDGFGDPEWLQASYGCGQSLASGLRERGFVVPRDARSNYPQTLLSLSSVLNLTPIQDWYDGNSKIDIMRAVETNRLQASLADAGYHLEQFPSEYEPIRVRGEVFGPWPRFQVFDFFWLANTALQSLSEGAGQPPVLVAHVLHRRQTNWVMDHAGITPAQHPTYRFVHLLVPHPPFVFEEDGSYRPDWTTAVLQDASHWMSSHAGGKKDPREEYVEGYCAKLRWAEPRVLGMIDQLLEARPDTVFVLHGDHGPGGDLDLESEFHGAERFGTMIAVRGPPAVEAAIYDGITLVNVYPAVLSGLFGVDVPRSPDVSYWSRWSDPFGFKPVPVVVE